MTNDKHHLVAAARNATKFAKLAVRAARDKWGTGWLLLSQDAKQDAAAAELFGIICRWDESITVTVDKLNQLRRAMLDELPDGE